MTRETEKEIVDNWNYVIKKNKKEKCYLISWCDDNHDPYYWLNEHDLGVDIGTIAESIIDLEIPKGTDIEEVNITGDSFPEEYWEQLFDYFQTIPTLDKIDVRLIIEEKWEEFYNRHRVDK